MRFAHRKLFHRLALPALVPLLLLAMVAPTSATEKTAAPRDSTLEERVADLEKYFAGTPPTLADATGSSRKTNLTISTGDNAWMLTSSALVLMMTGPGLALFYSGLVRRKNVLATMMQSFMMMCVITLLWAIYGYSEAFSKGNPFFGSFWTWFCMKDVGPAPSVYSPNTPNWTYCVFQLMFAIITPGLICGAYAERMKFSAMLLFTTLWATLIYNPLAHMLWGDGGFLNAWFPPEHGGVKALDFAGGTVVHISSGVSALVCALYLGKRVGYGRESFAPHNSAFVVIGACLLWVGWFGFNAGSAGNASSLASSAFVATHFATAAAALGWMFAEWAIKGKPTVVGACSGAVAGLVAITPASGYVAPMPGIVIGATAGVGCYVAVTRIKAAFGYDDSLDAFGVHGVGGTIGALLTGVFAQGWINAPFGSDANGNPNPVGWIDGNPGQVLNQIIAVLISWVLAAAGTFLILRLVDAIVGVRVNEEDERQGLDITQHGEEGYIF